MGESGSEKAVSRTNRKDQAGTTTIKKGWVQALPIKVNLAITSFIIGLSQFTAFWFIL
jgi:hypothetical protein